MRQARAPRVSDATGQEGQQAEQRLTKRVRLGVEHRKVDGLDPGERADVLAGLVAADARQRLVVGRAENREDQVELVDIAEGESCARCQCLSVRVTEKRHWKRRTLCP
jgi:hypothetical protein